MLKNKFATLIFSILITFSGLVAAADLPTISQVYAAAHAGKLDEAQQMINQVLQAHPESSKAHYVAAELLAKQGKIADARDEFKTAEKQDPGLSYAKPEAVNELKRILSSSAQTTQNFVQGNQSQIAPSGFPWGLLILGIGSILIITLLVRAFTSRNASVVYPNGYQPNTYNPMTGQPYPGGYAQPTAGGGMGSGIMGGLATGAAIGAGMVAGEALADHFIHGNNSTGINPVSDSWADSNNISNDNMGGNDFGIADNSSWDDNSSDISGGDDWT